MKRNQTFHEMLIPILVNAIGAESYLEFGTHQNETIGKVLCKARYGVDINPISCAGITMFRMSTQDFIRSKASEYAPYDFVFIDADYSAAAVEEDFEGIWPYVSNDGIVCLHDTNPETEADTQPGYCGDAWKFAKKLQPDKRIESVTLPYHPGLTIIRKRVRWGPE